jgi:hypothetical protein
MSRSSKTASHLPKVPRNYPELQGWSESDPDRLGFLKAMIDELQTLLDIPALKAVRLEDLPGFHTKGLNDRDWKIWNNLWAFDIKIDGKGNLFGG